MNGITAIIPAHPHRVRNGMLRRAVASVLGQTVQPDYVRILNDIDGLGSAVTRNALLDEVTTEWVAFLDSDDEWDLDHLETLVDHTDEADVIYSGCRVIGVLGEDIPLREEWGRFWKPFDGDLLRQRSYIPVTSMVRTDTIAATNARFCPVDGTTYDDWGFYLTLLEGGARFLHVPKVTWTWHHHNSNTSGQPDRGDARR